MVALREPMLIPTPKPEAAGTLLKRVLKHIQRGDDFVATGELEHALREYDAALTLFPDNPGILNNRGATLLRLGRHDEALVDLRRASEELPDDSTILTNLGMALVVADQDSEALRYLDRALVLRKKDDVDVLILKGLALAALGQNNEALAAVNQALALRPDDAEAQALHRELLDKVLRELVDKGFAHWSGGKPKGMKRPVKVTPGPPISDYIVEERERLRGPDRP